MLLSLCNPGFPTLNDANGINLKDLHSSPVVQNVPVGSFHDKSVR